MSRTLAVTALLGLACLSPAFAAGQEDLFRSDIAGIELTKPEDWYFQNLEAIARHRASVKLRDSELQEAMQQLATAPLVVATKHPEPYESLNPSFQLLVRPLGQLEGATGTEILDMVLPTLKSQFDTFKLVAPLSEIEVGGLAAGMVTVEYVVETQEGTRFPSRATLVAVPIRSFLYQFGFSAPPSGSDALTTEVEAVLTSVKFHHQ